MIPIVSLFAFAAVFSAVLGLGALRARPMQARLRQYAAQEAVSAFNADLAKPLAQKLFLSPLLWLGRYVKRLTPTNVISDVEKRLRQADQPYGLTVNSFLLVKAGLLIVLPVAYVVL